jgi:hypothetical protein
MAQYNNITEIKAVQIKKCIFVNDVRLGIKK